LLSSGKQVRSVIVTFLGWAQQYGPFFQRPQSNETDRKAGDKAMFYIVCWFENTMPQSVFFNSLGRAKFFVQRLQRNENCQKIFLEEAEAQAA